MRALAAPHEARSTRSAGTAPPRGGWSLRHRVPFAFTAPLGLVHPTTRTHVRLLGPCFKTGRRRRRPTRDRDAGRVNKGKDTRYTSPLRYPPATKPGVRGLRQTSRRHKLHPEPRSATSGSSREGPEKCCLRRPPPRQDVLADRTRHGGTGASLSLRPRLRERLRLPLHSFTYS